MKLQYPHQLEKKHLKSLMFACLMVLVYTIVFTVFSINRFELMGDCYDLSVFEQSFWSTVNKGEFLVNSQEGPEFGRYSHFSTHFSPFLFLIVPFYAIYQSPMTLLFAKTLFLGLSAIPLYYLSLSILKTNGVALVITGLFLLYPPLHGINLWGFHENEFAILPIFLMLCRYITKRGGGWFWIFLVLALSVKESISLTLCAFGFYILFFRPEKRLGLTVILVCITWFIVADRMIIPLFQDKQIFETSNRFFLRYDPKIIGTSYGDLIKNIISHPLKIVNYALSENHKQLYLVKLFFPLAFLPILVPSVLLIYLPVVAINLLTWYIGQTMILSQYQGELIPFIFFGFCLGINRMDHILEKTKIKNWITNKGKRKLILPLIAVITTIISNSSFEVLPFAFGSTNQLSAIAKPKKIRDAVKKALELIPKDAKVLSDLSIISHLGGREWLHLIDRQAIERMAWDYFIFDGNSPNSMQPDLIEFFRKSYTSVIVIDSIVLLKKSF